jgi:hypothetical protein
MLGSKDIRCAAVLRSIRACRPWRPVRPGGVGPDVEEGDGSVEDGQVRFRNHPVGGVLAIERIGRMSRVRPSGPGSGSSDNRCAGLWRSETPSAELLDSRSPRASLEMPPKKAASSPSRARPDGHIEGRAADSGVEGDAVALRVFAEQIEQGFTAVQKHFQVSRRGLHRKPGSFHTVRRWVPKFILPVERGILQIPPVNWGGLGSGGNRLSAVPWRRS